MTIETERLLLRPFQEGYAYEAAHAFFDYLFKDKGARRIYAYTEDYNKSSQYAILKKELHTK